MSTSGDAAMTADDARHRLRCAGLRSTSCRVAVLQHLAGVAMPHSHAEVADQLVPVGFDKTGKIERPLPASQPENPQVTGISSSCFAVPNRYGR